MDDFGVKYTSTYDAHHLVNALQESYDITINWTGKDFRRLDLDWNYNQGYVDISMRNFVVKTLQRLQHAFPNKP